MKYLHNLKIFLGILLRRLREQGLATTLKWLYAVGIPYLTGDLPLQYSRVTPKSISVRNMGSAASNDYKTKALKRL